MENKYYRADIHDIRIGYECEINHSLGYSDKYTPTIIELKDENGTYSNEISNIVDMIDDGYGEVRVPYLTKEQIEAEGWIITFREFKPKPYKVDWINAKKGNYNLWINLAMHNSMLLGIQKTKDSILYRGKCPSINEFRYICKLLNI